MFQLWAPKCGEQIVKEHCIPFAAIRRMSPEEFVLTLRDTIGVGGVVAGRNYRFGFKAAGTAATLVELGEKHGEGKRGGGGAMRAWGDDREDTVPIYVFLSDRN